MKLTTIDKIIFLLHLVFKIKLRCLWLPQKTLSVRRLVFVFVMAFFYIVPVQLSWAQIIYVDCCTEESSENGSFSQPFRTLKQAVEEASSGETIIVQRGPYPESLTINKQLTITASGGPVLVGAFYVGTKEVCVPINELGSGTFKDSDPLGNCSSLGTTPAVQAIVYYPALTNSGTQVACGGPFPAVVYAHGFRDSDWQLYPWSKPGGLHEDYRQAEGILTRLAAAGMIVISVDQTWASDYDLHMARGTIVLNTVNYLYDENKRDGSRFEDTVDLARVVLSGHSRGGAAAVYAVYAALCDNCVYAFNINDVVIKALALIAPATRGGNYPLEGIPMLVIHGSEEHTTQADNDPLRLYKESANTPKHLVVVKGANHFGYTDQIALDPEDDGDNPSTVGGVSGQEAQALQQRTAGNYVLAFLSHYLQGNTDALDYLIQQQGEQCDHMENVEEYEADLMNYPPSDCEPKRYFDDLQSLNVEVNVCSCIE